jgi:hypothetical protein
MSRRSDKSKVGSGQKATQKVTQKVDHGLMDNLNTLMREDDTDEEFDEEQLEVMEGGQENHTLDSILTASMSNCSLLNTKYSNFQVNSNFDAYCELFESKVYMGTPISHLSTQMKWISTFLEERFIINLGKYSRDVQTSLLEGKVDGINTLKHAERYRTVISQFFRFCSDSIHGFQSNVEFHNKFDQSKKSGSNQIFVNLEGLEASEMFDKVIVLKFFEFMKASRCSFNSIYNHSMTMRRILQYIKVNGGQNDDYVQMCGLIDVTSLFLKDVGRSARIGRAGQSKKNQFQRINNGEGLDFEELGRLSEWLMKKIIPFTEKWKDGDWNEMKDLQDHLITYATLELWGMRRQVIAKLNVSSLVKDPNGPNTGFGLTKMHEKTPRQTLDYVPISIQLGWALNFWGINIRSKFALKTTESFWIKENGSPLPDASVLVAFKRVIQVWNPFCDKLTILDLRRDVVTSFYGFRGTMPEDEFARKTSQLELMLNTSENIFMKHYNRMGSSASVNALRNYFLEMHTSKISTLKGTRDEFVMALQSVVDEDSVVTKNLNVILRPIRVVLDDSVWNRQIRDFQNKTMHSNAYYVNLENELIMSRGLPDSYNENSFDSEADSEEVESTHGYLDNDHDIDVVELDIPCDHDIENISAIESKFESSRDFIPSVIQFEPKNKPNVQIATLSVCSNWINNWMKRNFDEIQELSSQIDALKSKIKKL